MSTILNGANQQTEWFDLSGATSDVGFILEGDFQDAVSVHYSNNPAYSKPATSYITYATTYATMAQVIVPFGVALYVRFASGGSWTLGKTCTPRPGAAMDKNRFPYVPKTQDNIQPQVTA